MLDLRWKLEETTRDVPDPDSTIRYPVKCRHPAPSGIRVKFAGYLYRVVL